MGVASAFIATYAPRYMPVVPLLPIVLGRTRDGHGAPATPHQLDGLGSPQGHRRLYDLQSDDLRGRRLYRRCSFRPARSLRRLLQSHISRSGCSASIADRRARPRVSGATPVPVSRSRRAPADLRFTLPMRDPLKSAIPTSRPRPRVLLSAVRLTDGRAGDDRETTHHLLALVTALAIREDIDLTLMTDEDSHPIFATFFQPQRSSVRHCAATSSGATSRLRRRCTGSSRRSSTSLPAPFPPYRWGVRRSQGLPI